MKQYLKIQKRQHTCKSMYLKCLGQLQVLRMLLSVYVAICTNLQCRTLVLRLIIYPSLLSRLTKSLFVLLILHLSTRNYRHSVIYSLLSRFNITTLLLTD